MQDVIARREETERMTIGPDAAAECDFTEPAELFTRHNAAPKIAAGTPPADARRARSRATHRNAIAYRRFASAAEAIRFAMEELPPEALAATVLVVDGVRHESAAIRALYAGAGLSARRPSIPTSEG